ncbi:MAG: ABC transporter substrate-binding protein [Peptococcaceae bacterium]|nr:ABC transporter substrate-binding protein [Peptococcaceae bacterium]
MSRFNKSAVFLLVMLSLLTVLLAGCGIKDRAPKKARELVVGIGKDGNQPKFAEIGVLSPNANIYESLVKLGTDFQVEPLLATRWEYTGNNTWRFYLRRGVKFHNGREFTAEAVRYTLENAVRPSGKSILKFSSARVVDDYTVDITTSEPNMAVPEVITHPLFGIRCPGTDPAARPVGTGPFRFAGYEKDRHLMVEKNPDYWGTAARLDRITFKYIPDANTRIMALKAGEADMIGDVPREAVSQLKSEKGLQILASPVGGIYMSFEVRMNGKAPRDIMRDKRVRQALAYAIDRKAIVENVWEGHAAEDRMWLPQGMLGENRDLIKGFDYDPGKARELLDQAGWLPGPDGVRVKDGRRLEIAIVSGYPSAADVKPVPEIVQQQFKELGVATKIIEVSDEGLYEDLLRKGEGDLWLTKGNQNNADPTFGPQMLHHSKGYYGENCGNPWWAGPEFDNLIDRARGTTDAGERAGLVARALHQAIDEETALIPVALLSNVYAANSRVKGFVPHPSNVSTRWEYADIAE